jgi:hypothetical protein
VSPAALTSEGVNLEHFTDPAPPPPRTPPSTYKAQPAPPSPTAPKTPPAGDAVKKSEAKEPLPKAENLPASPTHATKGGHAVGKPPAAPSGAPSEPRESLYGSYLRAGGEWPAYVPLAVVVIASQAAASGVDVYLGWWSSAAKAGGGDSERPQSWYIAGYASVTVLSGCLFFARSVVVERSATRCASRLHDAMFRGLVGARIAFFEDNPSGVVLGRVGRDQSSIDSTLPGRTDEQRGSPLPGVLGGLTVVVAIRRQVCSRTC